MNSSRSSAQRDSLTRTEAWRLRGRTLEALALLFLARLTVAWLPFGLWRSWLGLGGAATPDTEIEARRIARHIQRAASRLPFTILCLPRAMALSWLLHRRAIPHQLVIAARPASQRGGADDLHAWVEAAGCIVLGELPGPWVETARFPAPLKPSG